MKIINLQEVQNRNHLYISLFLMLMFTLALIVFKVFFTANFLYAGIGFNLLLALFPFFISSVILFSSDKKFDTIRDYVILFIWTLTFPYTIYLITFFLHFNEKISFSNWLDMLIVLIVAFNGLLLAFISLFDIEKKLSEIFSNVTVKVILFIAIILGSLSVYIGKFLPWNGLDIINNPTIMVKNFLIVFSEHHNTEMINYVLIIASFLIFAYFLFRGVASVSFMRKN